MAKSLASILGFFWAILDGLRKTLHLILLLFLFAILIAAVQTSIPVIPATAALVLNPQGRIVEQLSGNPFDRAFERAASVVAPETQLRDIIAALEAAATDKRIKLVVLDLKDMQGGVGLNKLQEIGAALDAFRASGKKIIAVGDLYDESRYYLAARANDIYIDPLGAVFIDGYSHYRMYLKEVLDKLAIDLNVFKVGTYKSFTEVFTRTDMSAEEREQSLRWLNVLWAAYQADIIKARKLEPNALTTYIERAVPLMHGAQGNAAEVALEQKLVTAIKTREQMNAELKKLVGEDEDTHLFNAVDLDSYVEAVRAEEGLKGSHRTAVGILVASGEILDGPQPPGTVGDESLARAIRDARDNDRIKALVLRVDSPGGSMLASERIYRELAHFKRSGKPLVVSMSSVAASGGYYIAMGADEIWASPTTITGSIGVFATVPTFQNTLKKVGISVDGVGTSPLSGEMRLDRGLGPQAKALLQSGVEHAYREFLQRVSVNRKKPVAAIDQVAQGRVWAGTDAKRNGLVDQLGDLPSAVKAAARRAKLEKDYSVRYVEPELTWQESLAMGFRGALTRLATAAGVQRFFGGESSSLARGVIDPLERELKRWASLNDPRGLYAYCFCSLN